MGKIDGLGEVRFRFHHVGMVVAKIEPVAEYYRDVLGYLIQGSVHTDPAQKVRIQFLRLDGFAVELLEPLGPDSPVAKFLKAGGGLQHVCYECDRMEAGLEWLRKAGAALASPPTPAQAIEGRKVAFVVNKRRQLIELVEPTADG